MQLELKSNYLADKLQKKKDKRINMFVYVEQNPREKGLKPHLKSSSSFARRSIRPNRNSPRSLQRRNKEMIPHGSMENQKNDNAKYNLLSKREAGSLLSYQLLS